MQIHPCQNPSQPVSQFPVLFCLANPLQDSNRYAGELCRMVPVAKSTWAHLLETQEATRQLSVALTALKPPGLGEVAVSCPGGISHMGRTRGQAVLTFDVPGQVQEDPGKGPLSFQGDFFRFQMTHLDLESPTEDSRHSRQVIDFQHLLLARFNVALQSMGAEGGNAPERVWWRDGPGSRQAERRR